jgi:hypothetical protein
MKKSYLLAAIILVMMGQWGNPVCSLARDPMTFTWVGGGEWLVPVNWSPYAPPDIVGPPNGFDKAVIGTGTCNVTDSSFTTTGITVGEGAQLFINHGGGLWVLAEYGANPFTFSNNGTVTINGTTDPGGQAALSCRMTTMTLTGTGTLVLGGLMDVDAMGNSGWGGYYVNDTGHTIRGGGTIECSLVNKNQIIADHGTLRILSNLDNTAGTLSALGAGNILLLQCVATGGAVYPNDGTLILKNTELNNVNVGAGQVEVQDAADWRGNITLAAGINLTIPAGLLIRLMTAADGTPSTLTNNTVITLKGGGAQLDGWQPTTLAGTGRLVLGGDLNNLIYATESTMTPIINGAGHTIEGGGEIRAYITNQGKIIANNGLLKISRPISGTGSVSVVGDAGLDAAASLESNSLFLPAASTFAMRMLYGGTVSLTGDFSFAQTDVAKVTWGNGSALQLKGQGPWQSVEVGSQDLGLKEEGFTGNFALKRLELAGTGTRVFLTDTIDNGHRSPGIPEALYAGTLSVPPGTTLNLNGIKFYTHGESGPYWYLHTVRAGDGSLFGGGEIIDQPMSPGPRSVPGIITPLLLQ